MNNFDLFEEIASGYYVDVRFTVPELSLVADGIRELTDIIVKDGYQDEVFAGTPVGDMLNQLSSRINMEGIEMAKKIHSEHPELRELI